jgi:hypothetical protein
MKKLLPTIFIIGTLCNIVASNQLEIDETKWMLDLQALISMNSKKVENIQGEDKNSNGVRDDVEKYIWSKYKNDRFQRDIFFTAAKKIQEIISLPLNDAMKEHIQLDKELLEIYTCRDYILYRNEVEDIEQELLNKTLFKGKVLNTSDRLKAYVEHKKILPLNNKELTRSQLLADKNSCLNLYKTYENLDGENATLIINKGIKGF